MDALGVAVSVREGCQVVSLSGDLDADTAPRLDLLLDRLAHLMPVVIDLADVRAVTSAGVQALLRERSYGLPTLSTPPGTSVARVLEIVQAHRLNPGRRDRSHVGQVDDHRHQVGEPVRQGDRAGARCPASRIARQADDLTTLPAPETATPSAPSDSTPRIPHHQAGYVLPQMVLGTGLSPTRSPGQTTAEDVPLAHRFGGGPVIESLISASVSGWLGGGEGDTQSRQDQVSQLRRISRGKQPPAGERRGKLQFNRDREATTTCVVLYLACRNLHLQRLYHFPLAHRPRDRDLGFAPFHFPGHAPVPLQVRAEVGWRRGILDANTHDSSLKVLSAELASIGFPARRDRQTPREGQVQALPGGTGQGRARRSRRVGSGCWAG